MTDDTVWAASVHQANIFIRPQYNHSVYIILPSVVIVIFFSLVTSATTGLYTVYIHELPPIQQHICIIVFDDT